MDIPTTLPVAPATACTKLLYENKSFNSPLLLPAIMIMNIFLFLLSLIYFVFVTMFPENEMLNVNVIVDVIHKNYKKVEMVIDAIEIY